MSTKPRITVYQCLSVAGVEVDDLDVHVLLTGGSPPWSGTVTTRCPDDVSCEEYAAQVRSWRDEGHPVTVVERSGVWVLIDEHALFGAALGPLD